MGDAEPDTVALLIAVCVTVPVATPVAVFTPVPLLDAEAQEVLDGVKQPVPLSEGVTEAERHSVDVGDTDTVVLPLLEPALVAEEEGDTEKERDVEPLRVPVMLCVIVRDAESLTVTVGDTE